MKNVNKPSTSMKNWADDDKPREKLLKKGPDVLSNAELIAILIRNGTPQCSALDLGKQIMQMGKNNLNQLGRLSVAELSKPFGMGIAKAVVIAAALELGRRRHSYAAFSSLTVHSSKDIADYLRTSLKDERHEMFAVVFLNRANRIIHFEIISKGGITGTVADPKVIFKKALEREASSIILCHNHPSGNLNPSRADKELTDKIGQAANYLDIRLLDHIIVSQDGYYSFADAGEL